MLRINIDQVRSLAQFEVSEIEARRHRTACQRERRGISNLGSKPPLRFYDCLQHLTGIGICAQLNPGITAVRLDHVHGDWTTSMKVPKFIRSQPVESGEIVALEQEVDCRGNQPRPGELWRQCAFGDGQPRTVSLAIVPALRMRDEIEPVDPVLGGLGHAEFILGDGADLAGESPATTWAHFGLTLKW